MEKKIRKKSQKLKKPIKKNIWEDFLIPFLLLAFFLIRIGDSIRFAFRFLSQLTFKLTDQIQNLFLKVLKKEKIFLRLKISLLESFSLSKLKFLSLAKIFFSRFNALVSLLSKIKISKPKFPKIKIPSSLIFFLGGIIFSFFFLFLPFLAWNFLNNLPNPKLLSLRDIPVTTKIFDRNGFLLYEIYADQNRTPISLLEIPDFLKKATLAIEDKDFYKHPGFSLKGILRASKEVIFNHRLQGGSTITQQLIRSALLTPEPTISRKIKEILLSFWAERIYSKEQILEMYFNQIPYGGTAWGIEAASQTFFGKTTKELSLAEAAFLAALPSAPSIYSPYGIHPEEGLARQKEVLRKMVENSFITQKEKEEAEKEKLVFAQPKVKIAAPHFVMYVKEFLEKKYGPRLVLNGGLRVFTTLDLPLQEMAQEIVKKEIEKLSSLNVGNGAALITNPKTGEILAMVGSKDYFDLENQGNVNITLSLQQPGSAIKVVNYSLALENGFTAASILDDSPITFQIPGQPPYSPVNYDGKFHGKIFLREALANSYNVPAVKVLAKLGVKNMIEQGKKMGITSWKDESRYGLSLTLGGGEVTMLEMAKVYGTLANKGKCQELTPILKITDYQGKVLEEFSPKEGTQAISEGVAFILADILADNKARSAAFGPNSLLLIPGKTVSVKTGTSNDLRDNWAIGFTPSFVVVVWVGNNDNKPMNRIASGITGATPIWHQIMKNLLKDKEDEPFNPPDEIIKINVCGRSEYFIKGTEKNILCPPPVSSPTPLPTSL